MHAKSKRGGQKSRVLTCEGVLLSTLSLLKSPPKKKQVTEFHLVSVAAEREQICEPAEQSEMARRKPLLANWCFPGVFRDLTHDPYAD